MDIGSTNNLTVDLNNNEWPIRTYQGSSVNAMIPEAVYLRKPMAIVAVDAHK